MTNELEGCGLKSRKGAKAQSGRKGKTKDVPLRFLRAFAPLRLSLLLLAAVPTIAFADVAATQPTDVVLPVPAVPPQPRAPRQPREPHDASALRESVRRALAAEEAANPSPINAQLADLGTRQGELRTLLDQMLKKSSKGEKALGPEPDARTKLPEESTETQVEDNELDTQLLGEGSAAAPGADDMKPAEKSLALVGDRMARARQRLSVDRDPGKTTQIIQERILKDLDILIEQANQQSKKSSGKPKPGQGQKQPAPNPGQGSQPNNSQANGQSQPNNSTEGATESTLNPGGPTQTALGEDIKEKMSEWGGTTPRQREAVIEGASETVVEKYKKLVDDYYRSLATQSSQRR